ncbi:hypothetical protein K437DRAFT_139994 [Tilletiaria anomala UBC 951]|uniref:Uncharacterized protein n=1 Tax=Tilletiaria anomala (strain ATCC 24038 / CBS 436.72 / UBC 951) TaxID=1037660 RepID=A0A066VRZ0_TILAU|nr:uncharacterized protein K437DRAFT_139994 [Tilletiaria anomala UBC 951]KDN44246.1 hypothetical protein K437DRAFT_139994 [Tilletiaria anomala UBC 951]
MKPYTHPLGTRSACCFTEWDIQNHNEKGSERRRRGAMRTACGVKRAVHWTTPKATQTTRWTINTSSFITPTSASYPLLGCTICARRSPCNATNHLHLSHKVIAIILLDIHSAYHNDARRRPTGHWSISSGSVVLSSPFRYSNQATSSSA